MVWLLGFFIALFAAAVASEVPAFFGFATALALSVAVGAVIRQGRRIEELSQAFAKLKAGGVGVRAAMPAESPAPAVSAAPPAIPEREVPTADSAPLDADGENERAETEPSPPFEPARAPAPRPAQAPSPPLFGGLTARIREFFFEGNVPVKLGLLVLLLGVAALLRYAASAGWLTVPVSLRYAGIALAAMALVGYGLRQAHLRPVFGLALQGGGIGILLLTLFASFRVAELLPALPAFVLVLITVAGAAVLALRQNAPWLAALGFLGGYSAPLLIGTGAGGPVELFTYYLILNSAVFAMAWVRPWRALNLIGFAFTFGATALLGERFLQPHLLWTTGPFLVAFFLMYVGIPVAYALKGRESGKVDATLLFGTPLLAFPMLMALLDGARMPLAFAALAVAAIYVGLSLWSRRQPALRVLGQGSAALGLAFAALAVPLALSARWTSATWALQGVALLWLGLAQERRWPKAAGVALQLLAGAAYVLALDIPADGWAVANSHTLNVLILAAAGVLSAWLLDRRSASPSAWPGALLFGWGSAWWVWAGLREAWDSANTALSFGGFWLVFVAVTAAIATVVLRGAGWRRMAWWPTLAFVTAIPAVAAAYLDDRSWLLDADAVAFLVFAAFSAWALTALRDAPRRLAVAHIATLGALTLGVGLGIYSALEQINAERLGEGWRAVLPWIPLALVAALAARRPGIAAWPVADAFPRYRTAALGIAGAVLAWVWFSTLGLAGSAAPLPWVPLVNPLELMHVAGLLALVMLWRSQPHRSALSLPLAVLIGSAAFLVLSLVILRAAGFWQGIFDEYGLAEWGLVWATPSAQAALSVVWSLVGVVCWVVGSKRMNRALWTYGAVVLGAVLLKLLLIDRSSLGDLLGILSFLVVGGLLVLVGRLAPRPPQQPVPLVSLEPQ